jgi:PhnB protein
MQVQSYLFFHGRAQEAFDFYHEKLGAERVMMMRYKDSPDPKACANIPADWQDKVMHMSFRIGETVVLASDGHATGPDGFQNFGLSLTCKEVSEAERAFNGLVDGGKVMMPLGETFFSPKFGMVTDRFGVLWMVYVVK